MRHGRFARAINAGGILLGLALSYPVGAVQDWLAKEAVSVRSIDGADEDFSDLDPLARAIGIARVVQLGEPSHGAGSAFAAKVRLVKFLHERMGFDVLVWESGLYDLRLTEEALRAGESPEVAAQRGIFSIWSASAEVKPLFEYVKASQATMRPMEMAGFDLQFTSDACFNRFAEDLRSLVHALPDAKLRDDSSDLAERTIAAYKAIRARIETRSRGKEEPEDAPRFRSDLKSLLEAADGLLTLMRDQRAQLLQVRSPLEVELIERVTTNMRSDGLDLFDVMGPDRPAGTRPFTPRLDVENRRDALNASNLRWLIQEVYAGRKVIVWAHNAHVMNAYYASDWSTASVAPRSDTMKPMGVFLAEWLKEQVYTLLMTTYEGEDRSPPTTVPPAPEGSLESRIHRLGKQFAFLDLRSSRAMLDHPIQMRLPKYDTNTFPDLAKVADGVFYIDHMSPARGQP